MAWNRARVMFNLRSGNKEELVRHRGKEEGMKESLVCGEIVRCVVLCEFQFLPKPTT